MSFQFCGSSFNYVVNKYVLQHSFLLVCLHQTASPEVFSNFVAPWFSGFSKSQMPSSSNRIPPRTQKTCVTSPYEDQGLLSAETASNFLARVEVSSCSHTRNLRGQAWKDKGFVNCGWCSLFIVFKFLPEFDGRLKMSTNPSQSCYGGSLLTKKRINVCCLFDKSFLFQRTRFGFHNRETCLDHRVFVQLSRMESDRWGHEWSCFRIPALSCFGRAWGQEFLFPNNSYHQQTLSCGCISQFPISNFGAQAKSEMFYTPFNLLNWLETTSVVVFHIGS